MADLVMVLTIASFFALSWGFVLLCDRLVSTPDAKTAPSKGGPEAPR